MSRFAAATIGGFALLACSNQVDEGTAEQAERKVDFAFVAEDLDREVVLGDRGASVLAVYNFLYSYGYLPNADISERYPSWQPVVPESPEDPQVFGPVLEEAVLNYQERNGLERTGVADEATLQLMKRSRCDFPDGAFWPIDRAQAPVDSVNKWAHFGSGRQFTQSTVTFDVTDGSDWFDGEDASLGAAFDVWEDITGITFNHDPSDPDIEIRFYSGVEPPPPGWEAFRTPFQVATIFEEGSNRIGFNDLLGFSDATPTPEDAFDVRTVAIHEIGHVLGLAHSSVKRGDSMPVMWATGTTKSARNRSLKNDDRVAADALYGEWELLNGRARDIGVNPIGGGVWVIGTTPVGGGYTIHQRQLSNWIHVPGGAVRIAVAPNGTPWIVNDEGKILRRSGSGWELLPGCARDIGVASDGTAWVIGCDQRQGGYGIYRRNGSSWTRVSGGAVRIAGGADGIPWIVNDAGQIFRRSGSNWELLPGCATDVGVGGIDGTAWIIGCSNVSSGGRTVHVWNEQSSRTNTGERREWVRVSGAATAVSVDPLGRPWLVNGNQLIFRRDR